MASWMSSRMTWGSSDGGGVAVGGRYFWLFPSKIPGDYFLQLLKYVDAHLHSLVDTLGSVGSDDEFVEWLG